MLIYKISFKKKLINFGKVVFQCKILLKFVVMKNDVQIVFNNNMLQINIWIFH